MKTLTVKMKAKEAKALINLVAALNASEAFNENEELSNELGRLINDINDQLNAGKKTICLESDFGALSDEDFKKFELLENIDLDIDLEGLLTENEIDEISEVISGIVSDNSDDNRTETTSNITNKEDDNMKINNKAIFPSSNEDNLVANDDIRYGILSMIKDGISYSIVVTIDKNGSVTGAIDSIVGSQKKDEYIDRTDKWYAAQINYIIDHLDDKKICPYIPELMCSREFAIHYIRGNVFKTYEEKMKHIDKCYGLGLPV